MNFHGSPAQSPIVEEDPRIMFFDRSRNLADRDSLFSYDCGNDATFSPRFAEAITRAGRVWIVDSYLSDEPDAADELFFIVTAADVEQTRVITSRQDRWEEVKRSAEQYNVESRRSGKIELGFIPSREKGFGALPHDRFALVDGFLWHWGATVGGGYSGINACSYGWSGTRTGVSTWFDKLWEIRR